MVNKILLLLFLFLVFSKNVLAVSNLPGKVEMEDYTGFFDLSSGNQGNVYRTDDVDIQATNDAGGGYHLGWVQATEWVSYSVNVTNAGVYDLTIRVANTAPGGVIRVFDGTTDITGPLSVPNTGSWDIFQNIIKSNVSFTAGTHDLKFYFETSASNGWVGDFNYFQVAAPGTVITPTPTPTPIPEIKNPDTNNDLIVNILDFRSMLKSFGVSFSLFDFGNLIASYGTTINPTPTPAPAPAGTEWPMNGADPTRSSHNSVAVTGSPTVDWYRVIDPYIDQKVQVIGANSMIYLSTSKGLFAFDATNGAKKWEYGTEMPLGNAPTYESKVLYVGGYDHRVHAINADNGSKVWLSVEAGAGFETNPIVANNSVYLGNRDGYFYAFNASDGSLKWKFQTGGPIRFSAAYKNNVLYFGSDDSYAYAINATTGSQVWKSAKLPGVGFSTYWPVIYTDTVSGKDYVMFSGSKKAAWGWFHDSVGNVSYNYETLLDPQNMFANSGCTTTNCSVISSYFGLKPWERHFFALDVTNGSELSNPYPPINWAGVTRGGNKYPPLISGDGLVYSYIGFNATGGNTTTGTQGWISGWRFGTSNVTRIYNPSSGAGDEPVAFTSGGNMIYWGEGLNGDAWGSVDVTKSIGTSGQYYSWDPRNVPDKCTRDSQDSNRLNGKFWDNNGSYTFIDGAPNLAPIPYNGHLYLIYCNTLIALKVNGASVNAGAVATPPTTTTANITLTKADIVAKLEAEITKIIAAGHLRPGFMDSGIGSGAMGDGYGAQAPGNYLQQYFTTPYDTLWTLSSALPYLSTTTQNSLKTYLQSEQTNYPIQTVTHIGWKNGAKREIFDDTPEMTAAFTAADNGNSEIATTSRNYFRYYNSLRIITPDSSSVLMPEAFYGAYKYAQVFPSTASTLYVAMQNKLPVAGSNNDMTDANLIKYPYLLNEYIIGYKGYIELAKLAGTTASATVQNEYTRLVSLRLNNYSISVPFGTNFTYANIFNTSRNFMYMTPELGSILAGNQTTSAQIINEYNNIYSPYWFVSKYDRTYGEGVFAPLYDHVSHFLARAYILNQPFSTLVKYLDVPAFERGDLFYIQMLVALLQAP